MVEELNLEGYMNLDSQVAENDNSEEETVSEGIGLRTGGRLEVKELPSIKANNLLVIFVFSLIYPDMTSEETCTETPTAAEGEKKSPTKTCFF